MKFLSVSSGIEAASVAWNPLGWRAVAFSEIEPFPCAVLARHYPDMPNWGDGGHMTEQINAAKAEEQPPQRDEDVIASYIARSGMGCSIKGAEIEK